MKKVLLFLFMLFIPFFLKAEECDTSKITIDSINVVNTTGYVREKSEASVDNTSISLDLSMSDVGDSITYQIVVRNESEDDFELDESSMETKSEYIKYTFDDNDSVTIESQSTKDVELKVEYKNQVPDSVMTSDSYEEEESLTLLLSSKPSSIIDDIVDIINPKTGNNTLTIVLVLLIVGIVGYFISNKKKVPTISVIIVGLMMIIPIIINAICQVDISINSNVEIKKMAEFDTGLMVNRKLKALIGDSESISTFKKKDSLPNDVKTLVDSQLEEAEDMIVTEDEIQEMFCDVNSYVHFYHYSKEVENGIMHHIYSRDANASANYHTDEDEIIDWEVFYGPIKVIEEDSDTPKYLAYDKEVNELKLLTEEEVKEYIRKEIYLQKKAESTKNILSSDNSDYIIYAWVDTNDNSINYYTESSTIYLNSDSSYMFADLYFLKSLPGIENVDTSNVKDMKNMFFETGTYAEEFVLNLSKWDTSNVINMSNVFKARVNPGTNHSSRNNDLNLTNWDTSKVKNMNGMFWGFGDASETWRVKGIENWDTRSLKSINKMFYNAAYGTNIFNVDLSNWNTSNVESMIYPFKWSGVYASEWNVGNIENWDTSSVINMSGLFTGYRSNSIHPKLNLSSWDTSKVIYMANLFSDSGVKVSNLTNWDTSNVIDMSNMFSGVDLSSIGDISHWNTSNVIYMNKMFEDTYFEGDDYCLDLTAWNVSSVEDMTSMFDDSGSGSSTYNLNLSNWNTSKVESMDHMFNSTAANATEYRLNLFNWNTSNVTNMYYMFSGSATRSSTYEIIGLSNWDVSKVTNMISMFSNAGKSATTWNIGDLSNWNPSSITSTNYMFSNAGQNANEWSIGNISNWNLSNVTSMDGMFQSAGNNSISWNSIGTLNIYSSSITNIFSGCRHAIAIVNIYNDIPRYYTGAFQNAATGSGAGIVVNYTSAVTKIDNIIATKSSASNVTKGELITE